MCTGVSEPDWDELFMEAALDPDLWKQALGVLADQTGSARGQLIGIGADWSVPFNVVTAMDQQALREFVAIDGASPEISYRALANQRHRPGTVVHEGDYRAAMPALTTDNYVDYCHRHDVAHGCQSAIHSDAQGIVGLSVLRTRADGVTTETDRAVFARASKAAARAVRLQLRLSGQQAALLTGALEQMKMAAFVLGPAGHVLAATPAATGLLQSGDLALCDGKVSAPRDGRQLDELLSALFSDSKQAPLYARVRRGEDRPDIVIEGYRMPPRGWLVQDIARAMLVVRQSESAPAVLRATFGLTPAEADVAVALFRGESRASIAERRSVTQETLRGQIKAIYAKSGVCGEASLMRLFASLLR